MTSSKKDPVLVVLQLSGGNDYLNTVIPYTDPLYRDNRPAVGIADGEMLRVNDELAFHPSMRVMQDLYDQGNLAVIHGVGYPDSPRSHFRSMDIWHTCEPDTMGTEGWLGLATREIDPRKENVVTTVSMGPSMFRAVSVAGVPVAAVDSLDSYGLLTGIASQEQRLKILDRFTQMYTPTIGSGAVMEYLGETGLEAMKGADILKVAPGMYSSTVEYADTPIARKLKDIARIHLADLGTRIFYCDHGSFDSHANQLGMHANLWTDVSAAVGDFFADLKEHNAADNVICCSFPSSAAGCMTTAPAPITEPPGPPLFSASRCRAGSTANIPPAKPRICSRATWCRTWTSAASTAPSSRIGWAWTPSPSSRASSSSPSFFRQLVAAE